MNNVTTLRPKSETAAQSIIRQDKELRGKARRVAQEVHNDLAHASLDLAEISAMAPLPAGVRDIYRRLSAHIDCELQHANAILGRVE